MALGDIVTVGVIRVGRVVGVILGGKVGVGVGLSTIVGAGVRVGGIASILKVRFAP